MDNQSQKIGAIMVVGGGIAGMQASLDAAAAVTKSIWWRRTFLSVGHGPVGQDLPTNDCSTCLISPKLIELARHPISKS